MELLLIYRVSSTIAATRRPGLRPEDTAPSGQWTRRRLFVYDMRNTQATGNDTGRNTNRTHYESKWFLPGGSDARICAREGTVELIGLLLCQTAAGQLAVPFVELARPLQ